MVAIGRAMTLSPSILLLDEPFEGLAPVVVSRFIEAVKRIKAMGISLLIAESNLMTASRVADRLYAIDRGEIIFEGEPSARLREPRRHEDHPRLMLRAFLTRRGSSSQGSWRRGGGDGAAGAGRLRPPNELGSLTRPGRAR